MKAIDVISQLQLVLPTLTDKFSVQFALVSIIPAGNVATATTTAAHGRKTGDSVNIVDAIAPVAITSLSRSGAVVTAITTTPHDITFNQTTPFHTQVTLSGANEAEFNGTFPLVSSKNRNEFQFTVPDAGPTTGTGSMLLEDPPTPFGYNGVHTITVTGTTTFTYTLPAVLTENAIGGVIHSGIRVTGGINTDRTADMYTKQLTDDDLWAFVVLGDVVASKDRNSRNDSITSIAPGQDRRQQIFQDVSVIVYRRTTDDLSGREARDDIEDVRAFLIKALNGVKFNNPLGKPSDLGLDYVGDNAEEYDISYYSHIFNFQLLGDITNSDTSDPSLNVAFRDISLSMVTSLGSESLLADIDLDDDPL